MTIVYRAYSPSRDKGATPNPSRARAKSTAIVRNQHALTDDTLPADWTVQTGTVTWNKENPDG